MFLSKDKQNKIGIFAVAVISCGAILYWGYNHPSWMTIDDAFITYRYADNLRQGLGLLYNPGEWVLGTTTPLYALLLGGLGLFVSDLPLLGNWLAIFSWIAVSWAAVALLWQEGWPRAGLTAGLLLAVQPSFLLSLGMETALVTALMLWTAWAWLGGRKPMAVILAAALILTRQDSALWLLLLGLEVWRRERILPWREAIAIGILVIPWFSYAFWRYGSPLPNSAAAKFGQNEIMSGSKQLPFWRALWAAATAKFSSPVSLLYAALLVFGLGTIAVWARYLWWLVGWIILYVVSYMWFGVTAFTWYFVPPIMALNLMLAIGVGFLLGDSGSSPSLAASKATTLRYPFFSPWLRRLFQVLSVSLVVILITSQAKYLLSMISLPEQPVTYISVGQWLADNTPEEASVASIEIGLIGFYSKRPIVDTMGLVSPEMTDHQLGWVETLIYALNTYQPEYALALPGTGWDAVVNQWWFQEQYQEVTQINHVSIYRRQIRDRQPETAPVSVDFVGGLILHSVSFDDPELSPGETMTAWLNLEVQNPQPPELSIRTQLIDAQTFEWVAETKTEPFGGWYASDRWQPGDMLKIPIHLPIPTNIQPGTYRLGLTIFDPARGGGLPLTTTPEISNANIQVGWLRLGKLEAPTLPDNLVKESVQVVWQNGIELISFALPNSPLAKGDILPVWLQWQPSSKLERDLTVFLHVVDDSGQIVAQLDQRPFDGRWPTPAWQPGQVYSELYQIQLPDTLPAGNYKIWLGLYDYNGRVPLSNDQDNAWFLGQQLIATDYHGE